MLQCSTIRLYRHNRLSDESGFSLHHGICNMSCLQKDKKDKKDKRTCDIFLYNSSKLLILYSFTMFWHFVRLSFLSFCARLAHVSPCNGKSPDSSAVANQKNPLTPYMLQEL